VVSKKSLGEMFASESDFIQFIVQLLCYTLSILIEQPHQYFSLNNFLLTVVHKDGGRHQIPLIEKGKKFELVELTPVPFTANNSICQMNVTPNQVIVAGKILPLSSQDQMSCKSDDQELCFVNTFSSLSLPHSGCIRAAMGRKSSNAELHFLASIAPLFSMENQLLFKPTCTNSSS
jgi:hypothetical protein